MNSEVEKIKEDIIRECCNHPCCDDCLYSNNDFCCVMTTFNNRGVRFTPESVFSKLFKEAIVKECKMAENCELCADRIICQYRRDAPSCWK